MFKLNCRKNRLLVNEITIFRNNRLIRRQVLLTDCSLFDSRFEYAFNIVEHSYQYLIDLFLIENIMILFLGEISILIKDLNTL